MRALWIALLAASASWAEPSTSTVLVDRFDHGSEADGLPKGWKRLEFKKVPSRTAYSVESDGGDPYVRAVSSANGTGIFKELDFDLPEHPVLHWRWKVSNVVKTADVRTKDGDDYAARVYVAFRYHPEKAGVFKRWKYRAARAKFGDFPPEAALIYVWDNTHPIGGFYENAYTSRARMIIVESGSSKVGQWVSESRNVYEDYKKAFGREPPEVSFVALMTDTDNTGESATGYYADLSFSR